MLANVQQWDFSVWLTLFCAVSCCFLILFALKQRSQLNKAMLQQHTTQAQMDQLLPLIQKLPVEIQLSTDKQLSSLRLHLMRQQADFHQQTSEQQIKSFDTIHQTLARHAKDNREELATALTKNMASLTESTDKRLQDISGQVEKRLSEGFEKTTQTFTDILKRLALIDDAQKKITELSTNVVSLQEVLADKRSRGAFGEVQLNSLIRNVLPESQFSLQHTLSNGKVADCMLFLPKPTGNVVIDSKFPLESYQIMVDPEQDAILRKQAEKQFKQDIKKHISDIASKYLIENETADGAVMFIPAEAVFAEIHAHHSDLVTIANQQRVWLASPTTLMAILTTARAVLKDEATRSQVHIIQQHLAELAKDFDRFQGRFTNLARHIDQAATDVKQIHTSASKISQRFEKIEKVELKEEKDELLELS
ncbi:DNA recombination protein RmuC [Thalassotalea euphylliae]|uniref:DNA recombination protein RmuC n=1 Tax=Thalassotalea euphylliae TaxID=1655234 RepID=UPI00363EC4F3